jgi:hypothetical protein
MSCNGHASAHRVLEQFAGFCGTASVVDIFHIRSLSLVEISQRPRSPLPIDFTWTHCSFRMATQTESLTKAWNTVGRIRAPFTNQTIEATPSQAPAYHIEERQPVKTPVPFNSPLSVVVHLVKWTCWTFYFILRLRSIYGSSSYCIWAIYLCEVAFMVQDFQTAFDLSLSLFGPRKVFEHTQYILTGSQAPEVDVLVT